jgi:hypothetical protein
MCCDTKADTLFVPVFTTSLYEEEDTCVVIQKQIHFLSLIFIGLRLCVSLLTSTVPTELLENRVHAVKGLGLLTYTVPTNIQPMNIKMVGTVPTIFIFIGCMFH